MASDDDAARTRTGSRYPATDDVIAGVLVLFAIGVSAWFIYVDGGLPFWLMFVDSVAILTALVWVFGPGPFSTATETARKITDRVGKSE